MRSASGARPANAAKACAAWKAAMAPPSHPTKPRYGHPWPARHANPRARPGMPGPARARSSPGCLEVQKVTYRAGAPAVQALITNEVQVAMVDAVTALPLIPANSVVAIGVSSLARNPLAPNVPTIAESGFRRIRGDDRLGAAGARRHARADPGPAECADDHRLRSAGRGRAPARGLDHPDRRQCCRATSKWGEVIRARGITLE